MFVAFISLRREKLRLYSLAGSEIGNFLSRLKDGIFECILWLETVRVFTRAWLSLDRPI
jgi:hypothetical protein